MDLEYKDWLGQEITVGSSVVYVTRHSSSMTMHLASVRKLKSYQEYSDRPDQPALEVEWHCDSTVYGDRWRKNRVITLHAQERHVVGKRDFVFKQLVVVKPNRAVPEGEVVYTMPGDTVHVLGAPEAVESIRWYVEAGRSVLEGGDGQEDDSGARTSRQPAVSRRYTLWAMHERAGGWYAYRRGVSPQLVREVHLSALERTPDLVFSWHVDGVHPHNPQDSSTRRADHVGVEEFPEWWEDEALCWCGKAHEVTSRTERTVKT